MQVLNDMPQKAPECTSEHLKFQMFWRGDAPRPPPPPPPQSVVALHQAGGQVIAELWLSHCIGVLEHH